MVRIPLSQGYAPIPEGIHVFRIYDIFYDETFGKLEVRMVAANGMTHSERFSLMRGDGSMNDGALNAFSFLAKSATGKWGESDIDPNELVDCYIRSEVYHDIRPSTKNPGGTVAFAHLRNTTSAEGFDTTPSPRALSLGRSPKRQEQASTPQKGLDLDALLGS